MASTNILIIDDDEDTRLLVGEIARLAGYEPITAGTFPEARSALGPDTAAVLLDIVMPDQLCIRVAAFMAEEASHIPVVLISGATEARVEDMRRKLVALGLNVAATLRKPFWVDELLAAMSSAIPHASDAVALRDDDVIEDGLAAAAPSTTRGS
jgi:DNA-binding NtrC family response regulator